MLSLAWYTTLLSSVIIRAAGFVFLRWIPGHHFPPLVWTLTALYVPAFVYLLFTTDSYTIVSDEVKIVTRDVNQTDSLDIDPRYTDRDADPGQELTVEEEIELHPKHPQPFLTLLTGLPSPSAFVWSLITFLANVAVVLMVTDLVYRAPLMHSAEDLSFARVGFVSDTSAKVLVREPDPKQLPVSLSYRSAEYDELSDHATAGTWQASLSIDHLDGRTDFTDVFILTGLKPDTRYEYAVSNNNTGYLTTAPRAGQVSKHDRFGNTFTFAHSSCVKLNFPYSPLAHPLSAQGFQHLRSALTGLRAQFMLFLGDFIYADVPRQHGKLLEDYRKQYRQVYASPDWSAAVEQVPSWIHVYDDHEIKNDWSSNETEPFQAAFDAYELYHTSVNPPPARRGESYFAFAQGPATFFMLDTRRYRSENKVLDELDPNTGQPRKTMLGAQQRHDFLEWLERAEPAGVKWKVIISSVPFTKNWHLTDDTWAGFLTERQLLLEAMWDVGASSAGMGVIILSGDRHEFAATAFPPPPEGKDEGVSVLKGLANQIAGKPEASARQRKFWPSTATVHEFSASPLNMFYLPVRTYHESSTSKDYTSDVCVKYIPDGNHKFGTVSISSPATSDQSVLHYRLFVDGVEQWSHTLTTPPIIGGGKGWSRGRDAIWG